jgi:hypothetical protein
MHSYVDKKIILVKSGCYIWKKVTDHMRDKCAKIDIKLSTIL